MKFKTINIIKFKNNINDTVYYDFIEYYNISIIIIDSKLLLPKKNN